MIPADSASPAAQRPAAAPRPQDGGGGLAASPVAARMAAEHGIDLAAVPAAGARIQKEDVLAYLENQKSAAAPGRGPAQGPAL